jgi:hypothetical protein
MQAEVSGLPFSPELPSSSRKSHAHALARSGPRDHAPHGGWDLLTIR